MSRADTFTFRVNRHERQMIAALARRLQRSQSDAIRWLVREAVRELGINGGLPWEDSQLNHQDQGMDNA